MKGMGKMKRLLAAALCLAQLAGFAPHGIVHAHAQDCAHPNATFVDDGGFMYAPDSVYTDNQDGKTHSIMGYPHREYACPDCGVFWYAYAEEAELITQIHRFTGEGTCGDCGAVNTCEHPALFDYWYYTLAQGASWSANADGMTHSGMAYRINGEGCNFCGMDRETSRDEEPQYYTVDHSYRDGVCFDCGYENSCAHPEENVDRYSYYSLEPGVNWAANEDGDTHSAMAIKVYMGRCRLCNAYWVIDQDEEPQLYTVSHDYDNGVCRECAYQNSCAHPDEYVYEYLDYRLVTGKTWTINDNGTHTGECYVISVRSCDLCGDYMSTQSEQPQILTLEHEYYMGTCIYCGALNSCTHPDARTFTWNETKIPATADNGLTHTEYFILHEATYCYDSDSSLKDSVLDENAASTSKHSFSGNVCRTCGYERDCDHANTRVSYGYSNGVNCVRKDEKVHVGIFDQYAYSFCETCDVLVGRELVQSGVESEQEHVFLSDGYCMTCGCANTCTHESGTAADEGYRNYAQELTVSADGHTFIAEKFTLTYCPVCGVTLGETTEENVSVNEPHKLNSKGVCIICGYAGGEICLHENATQTGGNQKNKTVADNGNGTHTRAFDVYWEFRCDDCGAEFETYIERGEETEAHVAGSSPTVCTVCGGAMCARHYYRDGACIRCGYENDCAHAGATFQKDGRNENTVFTDNGDGTHTRTFDVYHFYTCPECEEAYAIYVEQGTETEEHEYPNGVSCPCGKEKPADGECEKHEYNLDGVCKVCGRQSDCAHSWYGPYISYEMIFHPPVYQDEQFHYQAYTVEYVHECKNCGSNFMRSSDMDGLGGHEFGEDGLCECGAQGEYTGCTHENTEFRYRDENVVYSQITDTTHLKTCDVYFMLWCLECDTARTYQLDWPNMQETVGHCFEDGVCACGYSWREAAGVIYTLPADTKTVGEEAFAGSAANAIVIQDGCAAIGPRAFASCAALEIVVLPASATSIAADAFDGCSGLTIIAPDGSAARTLAEELGITWLETK